MLFLIFLYYDLENDMGDYNEDINKNTKSYCSFNYDEYINSEL